MNGTAVGSLGRGIIVAIAMSFLATTGTATQDTPLTSPGNPADPIAALQADERNSPLEFHEDRFGYLTSLLHRLGINTDSQVLVFSKTSLQYDHISPQTPRAIYFNDNTFVAFVLGAPLVEMAALDPSRGIIFYTLEAHRADTPRFARGTICGQCHAVVNDFALGLMVTSSPTGPDGTPMFLGQGKELFNTTDHRTPFEQRWGGWYVTGTHGSQSHLGNAIAFDPEHSSQFGEAGTQNVTSLANRFDTTAYLAPGSDIVALMTLEHQTRMTNLIVSVSAQSRQLREGKNARATNERLDASINDLVTYMVFADEAPLREPVKGVSAFTVTFPERGPRDRQGRSLRDFDLHSRLFRYPLSYIVYSEAFDGMEETARQRVYQRLYDVLTGRDKTQPFAAISPSDRRAALEILRDTKPNLPGYWQ
jgi:hypothetical protein